jgi:hypothetical protein
MLTTEVERIARGYAAGESVGGIASALGRQRSTVYVVVADLVRQGRLTLRQPRRQGGAERRLPSRRLPPRQQQPRKCLGCPCVFHSPDPPAINRLCVNCTKRAAVLA